MQGKARNRPGALRHHTRRPGPGAHSRAGGWRWAIRAHPPSKRQIRRQGERELGLQACGMAWGGPLRIECITYPALSADQPKNLLVSIGGRTAGPALSLSQTAPYIRVVGANCLHKV